MINNCSCLLPGSWSQVIQQVKIKMKPSVNLKLIPAKEDDVQRILVFLQKYFFPDEPLNSALKRMPKTVRECRPLLALSQGHSYLAINTMDESQDNIVGVVLNAESTPADEAGLDAAIEEFKGNLYGILLKFLKRFQRDSEVWSKLKVDRALAINILAVKSEYRGLHIGKQLIEQSLRKAETDNYPYALIECSSFYSASLVEKLGFQCVYQVRYEDVKDDNGEVVFKTQKPHCAVKYLAKKLTT